jgi:hypothetical protein
MKVRDSDVLAWVGEQRKICQVLGVFGLLYFTMLRPVLAWSAFRTYEPFIYLIFNFFLSGCGKLLITETTDVESAETGTRLYIGM